MKKIQLYAAMTLFLGAMSFGLTSCGDDDPQDGGNTPEVPNGGDDNGNTTFQLPNVGQADLTINSSDLKMQSMTKSYVENVVYPTYQALAENARTLYTKCKALYNAANAGTMEQSQIDDACEAFKNARREWERSEAFLYGSAENNNIDPHIDSWPLDHDELVGALNSQTLIAGFKTANPEKFVSENNDKFQSVLGFHGLEFILFRDGRNRTVAELQGKDTFEGMESVEGIDELAFLAAVSGDVKNMTALLEFTWMGNAASDATKQVLRENSYVFDHLRYNGFAANGTMCYGQFLLTPSATTGYHSWPGTINQIFVGGCSNICNEVQEQKLGQAYRCAIGEGGVTEDGEDESIDYIESPYSQRSFVDYKDNIYSIKNSLYGTRDINVTEPAANSIMAYLKTTNSDLYTRMNNALNEALKSFDDAIEKQKSFVANRGSAAVKNCIDKVKECDDMLNEVGTWFANQEAE